MTDIPSVAVAEALRPVDAHLETDPGGQAGGHQVGPRGGKGSLQVLLLEDLQPDLQDFPSDDQNQVNSSER